MDRGATPKDHIDYQSLIEAAMKGVMRAALKKAAALGALPGEHHFYITFRTRMPGVQMADDLKDRFPDEMTIVIQHQYEDFEVHDDHFEISLRFRGIQQHLRIPFAAVTRFFDPSTNFALQFAGGDAPAPDVRAEAPRRFAAEGPLSMPEAAPEAQAAEGGTVVSLDAFRRK